MSRSWKNRDGKHMLSLKKTNDPVNIWSPWTGIQEETRGKGADKEAKRKRTGEG